MDIFIKDQGEEEEEESHVESVYYNKLHLCGCGTPDNTILFLYAIMKAYYEEKKGELSYNNRVRTISGILNKYGDSIVDFILNVLENADLFEHGGYIGNGWLTLEGEKFIQEVERIKEENQF